MSGSHDGEKMENCILICTRRQVFFAFRLKISSFHFPTLGFLKGEKALLPAILFPEAQFVQLEGKREREEREPSSLLFRPGVIGSLIPSAATVGRPTRTHKSDEEKTEQVLWGNYAISSSSRRRE